MEWPAIPYGAWQETCSALHLYSQIIGKYRIANTPWINHSWHATLYVDTRGLTTGPVADGEAATDLSLDLLDHRVVGRSSDGRTAGFALGPGSVADFQAKVKALLAEIGATPVFNGRPSEIANGIPFAEDSQHRPYDADAVTRFFKALLASEMVFRHFRTGFLGKASPVHFFWGSFDLAVTRFSGRRAPTHPGGVPALPDDITQEAYSHQVSSAGFWPGGGAIDYPAFYSYAYPGPDGFARAQVRPKEARFDETLGEFILPYDEVRTAADPEATLMAFLQSTYEAAADLGSWDRANLDCEIGQIRKPRRI